MTLKEKFKNWLDTNPRLQIREAQLETIADNYAIEFAEWLSKKERTKFQCLSYCKKTIMWFTSKKGIGATTKELLEIFKKEKELLNTTIITKQKSLLLNTKKIKV